jgi:protein involved in polysaccharide export with SLBB domain
MALIIFCQLAFGQLNETSRARQSGSTRNGNADLSDLAKDNLDRVAASSIQIREVLVKDAGLLVELKRWVAREATDNGQVVEDSNLSEQAIFDRLDHDLAFRSVATRLLQRYGYLLPAPNPDSSFAKEQELVLKERARLLVQIEAKEDADALNPGKKTQDDERDVERTHACNPEQDGNCTKRPAPGGRQNRPDNEPPASDVSPGTQPDIEPLVSPPRTLRTDFPTEEKQPGIELASNSLKFGSDSSMFGAALTAGNNPFYTDRISAPEATTRNETPPSPSVPPKGNRRSAGSFEEDVMPVRMVRPANPFADIPSLYDLYVQAAPRQRPAERFGLAVFRNTTNQPEALPMDLPVGPDYVVGTGDSLAIDLWGGVSQRLVRLVDREGRVSLPETGPLLVSGKNLGEVQTEVQRALRTQFRDISADVSLSRLRTVRVYVVGDVAEPGAYDISSLSTPLNALFAAGGVTARGSLRALRHTRGTQLVQRVDAYDLLLHGVRSDLQRLENGDTLLVPPMGPQVTVDGMVRRPAVYELLDETSLAQVLELAGGILPTAALRHIEVQRVEAHEKRTMLTLDLSSTSDPQAIDKQLQAFQIRDGDQIHIFPIAAYNEDSIYLQGHVLRPGRYSYKPGMKLTDLISSYNDLLPECSGFSSQH